MKYALFCFILLGWILGVVVHLLDIKGVDVTTFAPRAALVYCLCAIPASFFVSRTPQVGAPTNKSVVVDTSIKINLLLAGKPLWVKLALVVICGYIFISIIKDHNPPGGIPDIQDGHYVLTNHGKLIRTLTEQEYHLYRAGQIRFFSRLWLLFFSLFLAFLFPERRRETQDPPLSMDESEPGNTYPTQL